MFVILKNTCVEPDSHFFIPSSRTVRKVTWTGSDKVALIADILLGVALLTIGVSAARGNFLSTGMQNALIGSGATYLFLSCLNLVETLKALQTRSAYVIRKPPTSPRSSQSD